MNAPQSRETARVTAIVVTRDRPQLLADALASIATQSLPPAEIIVANDGECSIDAALAAAGAVPVLALRVPVRNPGAARNRAAASTTAPWLAFLDDDDRWLPDHLAGLAGAFEDPSVEVAYRDCAVIREEVLADGRRIERERLTIARDWDDPVMKENDYIPPSSMAIARTAFERLGGFDESFTRSEDWDLLLRVARTATPRRVPGVSVEIRLREHGNASSEAGGERRDCLARLSARHGLPPLVLKTFWEVAADLRRLDAARSR